MRNRLALLGLALCLGTTTAWASPVTLFITKQPTLIHDPDLKGTNLSPLVSGMQWFAEQQAIRTRLLFPKEMMEADVPIGPQWVQEGANSL